MKTPEISNGYNIGILQHINVSNITGLSAYLVWPVLLGLNTGLFVALFRYGVNVGLALTLSIFSIVFTMIVTERWLTYRNDWQPTVKEWWVNLFYFMVNGAVSNLGAIIAAMLVVSLSPATTEMSLMIAVPVAILVSELAGYWWHRIGHESTFVWRFHAIHHLPKKINIANNNTVHFVDLFTSSLLGAIPALLLGLPAEAIAIAMFYSSFQSFFAHINAKVKLGWLGYIVMGPEHHRYHHSVEVDEALNYSVSIAIWDQIFGTFLYRPYSQPEQIGIKDDNNYPDSTQILKTMIKPFH